MPRDIKLSKSLLFQIIQLGRFTGALLRKFTGPLMKFVVL